jgi:hypothetical protein
VGEGVPAMFLLDSGASDDFLHTKFVKPSLSGVKVNVTNADGSCMTKAIKLKDPLNLYFHNHTIPLMPIVTNALDYDGILGWRTIVENGLLRDYLKSELSPVRVAASIPCVDKLQPIAYSTPDSLADNTLPEELRDMAIFFSEPDGTLPPFREGLDCFLRKNQIVLHHWLDYVHCLPKKIR